MVFYAMEMEVRSHIQVSEIPGVKENIIQAVKDSEDVTFYWTVVAANWESEEAGVLLDMVTKEWITLRGFSHASARYKQRSKKGTQKSKGLRKNLIGSTSNAAE